MLYEVITAFVFTGMGPQWWRMGRQLMREEAVFRAAVEEVDALLRPLAGWSLLEELAAEEEASRITETDRVLRIAVHYPGSARTSLAVAQDLLHLR